MAADNIASAYFWQYELGLNVDFFWDPSHRVNNDINNGIKSANKWDHMVMALIRVNVTSSPWLQDTRYRQIVHGRDEIFERLTPRNCSLYREFLPQLLSEEPTARYATEPSPGQACWDGLHDENVLDKKYAKTVVNRFCDVVRALERDLYGKTQRKWFYLHTAVEMDMFSNPTMAKIVARSINLVSTSTSSRIEPVEDAAIRKSNANQLVVALMDMLDPDTYRTDAIIVSASKPWESWHGRQNADLRSVHATSPWLREQLDGKFLDTIFDTLGQLNNPTVLDFCEFVVPIHEQINNLCRAEVEPVENMHAKVFAFLCVSIDFHRLKSCAPLLIGWQNRSVYFQRRGEKARSELNMMKRDRAVFLELEAKRDTVRGLRSVVMESPGQTLPMLRIYKVAEEDHFQQCSESCDWYTQQQNREPVGRRWFQ